jgi:PAS domain S-box-containing protein
VKNREDRHSVHSRKTKAQLIDELTALEESLESLDDSFVLYDSDDKIIFFNNHHKEFFPLDSVGLQHGASFREILEKRAFSGLIEDATGREKAWMTTRIAEHENPGEPVIQRFSGGRIFRLSERKTPSGNLVALRTEITDFVNAETSLQENKNRFRLLAEIGNDWFWQTNEKHQFISYLGYSLIRGLPDEGITGVTRWENASEQDLLDAAKWTEHKALLDAHKPFRNFEFELITDPPEWISVSGDPVFDDDGKFTGHQGTATIITRRKKTEILNERLVTAFDAVEEVVAVLDADERFVFCNKKFLEVNKDVLDSVAPGKTMEDHLRAMVDAGIAPAAPGEEEAWLVQRMERFRNPSAPFETFRKDGTWLQLREQRLSGGGTILLGTDITEMKKTQNALQRSDLRLRDFLDSTTDWLWEMGSDLKYTFVSEQGLAVTHLKPEEVIGRSRNELFSSDAERDSWYRHVEDLKAHRPFRDHRYTWLRGDGKVLYLSTSGRPFFDDDGNFLGYRGTGTDYTDQTMAEGAYKIAMLEAERANRAKSEFLATMSHEFRTPLNAILGFGQLLENEYFGPLGSEKYQEYVHDIQYSGTHMLALVNDVLDISAIEAGKRTFQPETINIDELLASCLRNVEKLAEDKGVSLSLEKAGDLAPFQADRRSMTQIFNNLLSNAVKFTDRGGFVNLGVVSDDKLTITVTDTGIGIPAEKLPMITEPFSQLETNPLLAQEGTGLGLSIVKSLIEALGGELVLESVFGEGTTISVSLPLKS